MTTTILCMASFCFLGWVLLLKVRVEELEKENRKLKVMLDLDVRKKTGGIEVSRVERAGGIKRVG